MTTRREAKAQTRQRLLDAMIDILHEAGPLALTTGRIAERAGIAQPTFYVHFTDLDRAMEIAADEAGARLIRIFSSQRTAIESGDAGRLPGGRLRLVYRTALEGFLADRRTTELFLRHRRDTASPFATRFRVVLTTGRDQLRDLLARGGAPSADIAAAMILGMVISVVESLLDGRIPEVEPAVDRLVIATRALLAPKAATK